MEHTKSLFLSLLMTLFSVGAYAQTNRLYIPDLKMSRGSEATLSVFMDNAEEITAVEFTLEVPTGFTVNPVSAVLTERAKNHQMTARKLKNGNYKFVIMSQSNAAIEGIAGRLFTVRVKSPDNVTDEGDYPLTISSAVMSVKSGQNVLQEADGGKITIKSMPNLHVVSLDCSEPVAGQPLTVKWKIRNDGRGSTGDASWKDYIWLVPNISAGTSMTGSKLLKSVDNVTALASGESYENTVNVTLEERIYGNYDLVVTSNMYGANSIDFTKAGGSAPVPYDPENADYGFLTAKGNASYVTVEEENEYDGVSDNFFYKRINIQVPPLADIQVSKVVVNIDNSDYTETSGNNFATAYGTSGESSFLIACAVITSGQASSTAFYSGKKVRVTATIENKGKAETGSKKITNYMLISSTPDMSSGKVVLLAANEKDISLQADETTTAVFSGYIPIDWYGDTYFIVLADVNDEVYELANTANNIGSSNMVNVLLLPGPDLEPYNLSVPSQISSDAPFSVNYSVRNIGPGTPYVSSWKDKIYISAKSSGLDDTAICLKEITRTGAYREQENNSPMAIAANTTGTLTFYGDAYQDGYSVKTGALPAGTYYIYVKSDANDDVFEFDGEDNNVIVSGPVTLNAPDLVAELIALSEDTLRTGNKVAVSWRLRNIGSADIQNTTVKDGFYASSNANGTGATLLGSVVNTVSIAANSEKALRANITIPENSALNGKLYLFVKTNIDSSVAESSTANNSSDGQQKSFEYTLGGGLSSGVNLAVSSVLAPDEGSIGGKVALAYTIKNAGSQPIPQNVQQEVFISKKNTFDASAIACAVTGTMPDVTGLKSNETTTANVEISIPSDKKGGAYYIYVVINRNGALSEKKSEDNYAKSPFYISGNLPNLVVSNVAFPTTVMTSENAVLSWTLANNGEWDAEATTCAVYLSSDGIYSKDDLLLATLNAEGVLKGAAKELKTTISLDDDVVGTHYLIVRADSEEKLEETSKEDNTAGVAFTSIQSPLPDLAVSDLSADGIWRGGQPITIHAKVRNIGDNETRKDKWTDVFYLSDSYTLDVSKAVKLGSKTHVGKLAQNGEYEITASLNIPSDIKGYYVLFAVADGTMAMVEKNKENNQTQTTVYVEDKNDRPADLLIRKVSVPSTIMAGEPVTISYTLANEGEYSATGLLRDVLYMSKDNQWDTDDVMVGVVTDEITLEPGNETVRTVTGRITNMPEGSYYLIVRTNSTHAIAESDYDNNMLTASSTSSIEFSRLPLGSSVTVSTSGIYKLPLYGGMEGKTIGIYLSTPQDATAGLYTAYETVPSTARYDRAATDLEQTEQEVLIPDAKEGTYYILAQDNAAVSRSLADFGQDKSSSSVSYTGGFVVGHSLPSEATTAMTLSAREVQFGATTLSIAEGGTNGWISTEIHGALLDSIMDFRLAREGEMIPAESITFYDQTSSKATFNLNDAQTGNYNVVSELPNGTQATLPDGFKVVPGTNVALGVKLDAPKATRISGYGPVSVTYVNGGNTDIVIRELLLTIRGGQLSTTIEGFKTNPQTALHIRPDVKQDNRGFVVIPPGKQETVNYYFLQTSGWTYLNLYIVK